MCQKHTFVMVIGMMVVFIGFVMTMYGYIHKPFWSDARTCSFCKDDREITLQTTKNCRTAGPVFIGIGVVIILVGVCFKRKSLNDPAMQGVVTRTPGGVNVTTYATTGNIGANTGLNYTSMHQQQMYPTGYYQQDTYPLHQSTYPPLQSTYPPAQVTYPPPRDTYPPSMIGTHPQSQPPYPYPAANPAPDGSVPYPPHNLLNSENDQTKAEIPPNSQQPTYDPPLYSDVIPTAPTAPILE